MPVEITALPTLPGGVAAGDYLLVFRPGVGVVTPYIYSANNFGGSGGGGGLVNSGAAGTLAYYQATGTAVYPLTLGTNLSISGTSLNAAATAYTLPVATNVTLGGVKQGTNTSIGADGTISVSLPTFSQPSALTHRTIASTDVIVIYDIAGNDYYINPSDLVTLAATTLNKRQTIAYSSSITPDISQGRNIEIGTLTGNPTINNPTNPPEDGGTITIRLVQDSTGNRVPTWGSKFKGPKTLSTAANAVDRYVAQYRLATDTYEGAVVQGVGA